MSSAPQARGVTFGFEEFWPAVQERYGRQFGTVAEVVGLANEMDAVARGKGPEPVQKVVYVLTRITTIGMNDVVLLCGNGCGTAAMKVARGMFESATTSEYLRRNPAEVDDYLDFGRVIHWRRYQWLLSESPEDAKRMSADQVLNIEVEYDRVKPKFSDTKGRVRNRWSTKTIREITEAVGRVKEYELPYSLGASLHHSNAEGLLAYLDHRDGKIVLDSPPSFEWVPEALLMAHTNLLTALDTLNDACDLGFTDKLKAAVESFHKVWRK